MTEEKNYKDWLVVSDIDGTLNDKRRNLPERNLKAITDFVKNELGHASAFKCSLRVNGEK